MQKSRDFCEGVSIKGMHGQASKDDATPTIFAMKMTEGGWRLS